MRPNAKPIPVAGSSHERTASGFVSPEIQPQPSPTASESAAIVATARISARHGWSDPLADAAALTEPIPADIERADDRRHLHGRGETADNDPPDRMTSARERVADNEESDHQRVVVRPGDQVQDDQRVQYCEREGGRLVAAERSRDRRDRCTPPIATPNSSSSRRPTTETRRSWLDNVTIQPSIARNIGP